jgi:hypothetical protein
MRKLLIRLLLLAIAVSAMAFEGVSVRSDGTNVIINTQSEIGALIVNGKNFTQLFEKIERIDSRVLVLEADNANLMVCL